MRRPYRVLTGTANVPLSQKIGRRCRKVVDETTCGRQNDGEVKVKLRENVREYDVFPVQPMDPRDHSNFMELLALGYTAVSSSAGRVIGVIPYFGYARADRKDQPRVGVLAKLVADMIQVAGYNRLICVDLHAAQIQGFFDPKVCVVDHLYARPVMIKALTRLLFQRYRLTPNMFAKHLVLVAPDVGATKMVASYASRLNCRVVFCDKRRKSAGSIQSLELVGDVRDCVAVGLDDIADTAKTMCLAGEAAKNKGARHVLAVAVHPVLSDHALENIARSPLETLLVSDSLLLPPAAERARIQQVSLAPLLAEAIMRTNSGRSLSPLIT